ncbi:MAG TPA: primosomal protein N', partial [Alphaproteobacteria bacterium]
MGRGLGEGRINPFQGKARPKQLTENARELRQNQTDVEKKLWHALNDRQLHGFKFRRQYAFHPYIADFACPEKNLIVELDGGQHAERQEYDCERTAFFEKNGFKVLRFWNNEVIESMDGILQTIADALTRPSPNPLPTGERALKANKFLQNLSPQRRRILDILSDGFPRRVSEIAEAAGCTPAVVKGLLKYNLIEETDIPSAAPCRKPDITRPGASLSGPQGEAARNLCEHVRLQEFKASLLDGVTGAGKTEVYFEGVAEALKNGKQVLILLPEIALSNAFLERFKSRFGCAPALWHSALAAGQRKNTWRGVATGETKVIVGARSALFLPFRELGLIVVDEEHDSAYKQEDGVIYNARDMAVVRAHLGKIPIVLVSATPSLETMANIWAGRYEHLRLPDRHGVAQLPSMHLIDMKKDKPARQYFIAPPLHAALEKNLAAGEQSLLFLNRRGYAPLTICRTCGHRISCPRCTAWLVEHKKSTRLHCHHCGFSQAFPKACTACGDHDSLAACGPGVERILEEVKLYFPQARTVVLASDTAGTQEDLRALLNDIREHKYDIIVGTQIIAKGHHFPR